jgi:hypothetical protein
VGYNVGLSGATGFGLRRAPHLYYYNGSTKGYSYLSIPAPNRSTTTTRNGARRRSSIGPKNCSRRCSAKAQSAPWGNQLAGFRPVGWSPRAQGATATWWTYVHSTNTWQCPSVNSRHWTYFHSSRGKMMLVYLWICSLGIMHLA